MMVAQNSPFTRNIFFICPIFELFHPFKILMEKIWSCDQFYYTFWAPSIYPDSAVFLKPKLKDIEITLTSLRLAYPVIQQRLHSFLREQKNNRPTYTHARNLFVV